MLTYSLLSINKNEYIYLYYPNGNIDAPGKISIKSDGTRRIICESADDIGQRYANHALRSIDINRTSGTIAWY